MKDANERYFVTNLFIERCLTAKDPTGFLMMMDKVTDIIEGVHDTPPKKKH